MTKHAISTQVNEIKNIEKFKNCVEIIAIQQLKGEFTRYPALDNLAQVAMDLEIKNELSYSHDDETRFFSAFVSIQVVGKSKIGESTVDLIQISSLYRISYKVRPEWTESLGGTIKQFCETNSIIHVWSYARNFVHESSLKMWIQPIMLPLMVFGSVVLAPPLEPQK